MPDEFDFNSKYKVNGYGNGVAWYCIGYEVVYNPDDEWTGFETHNKERVRCIMVGDDRVETFDVDELTKISEDEYCPECGQIGCKAYG